MAGRALESSLLKYSAKEYFFRAALCHLCVDALNAQHAIGRYEEQYPGFADSREAKLVKVNFILVFVCFMGLAFLMVFKTSLCCTLKLICASLCCNICTGLIFVPSARNKKKYLHMYNIASFGIGIYSTYDGSFRVFFCQYIFLHFFLFLLFQTHFLFFAPKTLMKNAAGLEQSCRGSGCWGLHQWGQVFRHSLKTWFMVHWHSPQDYEANPRWRRALLKCSINPIFLSLWTTFQFLPKLIACKKKPKKRTVVKKIEFISWILMQFTGCVLIFSYVIAFFFVFVYFVQCYCKVSM